MALVTVRELGIGFHGPPLLDDVTFQIEPGERIGLLGRNGAGKTTLLRILCGEVEPDSGEVVLARGVRASLLPQEVSQHLEGRSFDIVARGLPATTEADAAEWQSEQRIAEILSRMELDGEARFESLSSGMKRRVLLAQALVSSPDLLLLDEPTNHLDLDAISWLEDFLARWNATLIFVTHDRVFLGKLANRILEIDRGRLFDWSCDYDTFLRRREVALAAEEAQNALFDKKLAREEVWLRQGIKARRTRNEGRVRALEKMRRERGERRAAHGQVRLQIQSAQRTGNLVAEVDRISFGFDERDIVRDFSTTILRGDKIGIIGPNGAGKTTLVRLLLGELPPRAGTVRLGTRLETAYFDQLREQLDEDETIQQNVGGGSDTVKVGGKPQHILGYLQNFLISPDRARTPVSALSGGERNRVLLARLFARPANVIVLDEPTNDLDTETLELLEDRLVEFDGTVLLVSHDRAFLNNVVTSTIAFEDGRVNEYVGGYDDWLRQRSARSSDSATARRKTARRQQPQKLPQAADDKKAAAARRLSYKEKRELTALPTTIERLEDEISALHQTMASPEFYQQAGEQIADQQTRLKSLESELATAYERWEELEARAD